jgi:transposase
VGGGPLDHHAAARGRQAGRAGRVGRVPAGDALKEQDLELAQAKAEAARLGEALKELAVKLLLVEGKGRWG